jgi:hypothetical protein
MRSRTLSALLVLPVFAVAACGGGKTKDVNTAQYTCAKFSQSLATKGDDSAGNFINQLRKQAKLGQNTSTERREITLGIFFACRNKPGTTKPAAAAVTTAKKIKAGKFHLPAGPGAKKKSAK